MIDSVFQQPLGQMVRENIVRAQVFEKFGIDYCCGGEKSLAEACRQLGLNVDKVCHELDRVDEKPWMDHPDLSAMPLSDLIDHIVEGHHAFLRRELPRLDCQMARVAAAHGLKYCHLQALANVHVKLEKELQAHMLKEEQVLFPIIKQLEYAESEHVPSLQVAIIDQPISVMQDEHRLVGDLLRRMRQLSNQYTAPTDACPTYHALMTGLAQLEQDLYVHIHKENNILFPRAEQLETMEKVHS